MSLREQIKDDPVLSIITSICLGLLAAAITGGGFWGIIVALFLIWLFFHT